MYEPCFVMSFFRPWTINHHGERIVLERRDQQGLARRCTKQATPWLTNAVMQELRQAIKVATLTSVRIQYQCGLVKHGDEHTYKDHDAKLASLAAIHTAPNIFLPILGLYFGPYWTLPDQHTIKTRHMHSDHSSYFNKHVSICSFISLLVVC